MDGKDHVGTETGLLPLSTSEYYETISTGLHSHPPKIVIPFPLTEEVNANKIENLPEKINLPVEPKAKILEKAVISNEDQKKIFKRKISKRSNPENDIESAASLAKQTECKSKKNTKKKRISAEKFSFY